MFDDLTGAPFYCLPDMMHINNDETGADSCFWFDSDESVVRVCVAASWVEGWIARDAQQLCDDDDESDDKSDDGECGELASKYNELSSFPFIITSSENDNPSKRCKLFI